MLILLFALISGWSASGTTIHEKGFPLISNYKGSSYKAHAQNWDITQDNRDIIYIANGEGVLTFDGKTWQLVKIKNNNHTFH